MTTTTNGQQRPSRIFVGGLTASVTEQDLRELLARFGEIVSVKIKTKDQDSSGYDTFAFVEMNASPSKVNKCLTTFSNTRWKGCTLKLQLAKESFLNRLQKERESYQNGIARTSVDSKGSCNLEPLGKHRTFQDSTTKKQKQHANDEDLNEKMFHRVVDDEVTDEAKPASRSVFMERLENFSIGVWQDDTPFEVVDKNYMPKPGIAAVDDDDDEADYYSRSNNLLKSQNHSSKQTMTITKTSVTPSSEFGVAREKHELSDKRRLQTLDEKRAVTKLQQSLVKASLLSVDANVNKKITFGSENESEEECYLSSSKEKSTLPDRSASKLKLFENDSECDDDDGDASFNYKPQFQGETGQKLIQLQNRYGNDARFKIDQRFVEEGSDAEDGNPEQGAHSEDLKAEKLQHFAVLESVLGYQLQAPKEGDVKTKFKSKHWTEMIPERYDPAREGHEKFEIQRETPAASAFPSGLAKSKKSLRKEQAEQRKLALPEVSKKRFFEVEQNLADGFKSKQESGAFSLSRLFDDAHGLPHIDLTDECEPAVAVGGPRTFWDSNPFVYDSSSDDNGDDHIYAKNMRRTSRIRAEEGGDRLSVEEMESITNKRQTFFLFKDDPRLKEGPESFKRYEDMQVVEEKWRSTRAELMNRLRMKRKRLMTKLSQNQKREMQDDSNKHGVKRKLPHATKVQNNRRSRYKRKHSGDKRSSGAYRRAS